MLRSSLLTALVLVHAVTGPLPCTAQSKPTVSRGTGLEARPALLPDPSPPLAPTLQNQRTAERKPVRVPESVVRNTPLRVPPQVRLMVFAPHPDDEAIAAAGLIQRVVEKGGKAKVVFVTNGDGYQEGVRLQLNRSETTPDDFIVYGEQRQIEARQAAAAVGLAEDDVIFLGFPDGGIDDLWLDHWSSLKPYTSPQTRLNYAQYRCSFCRYANYSGTGLMNQMLRTILEFAPDWVVLPDPRDLHPDHYTTGVFVLEALRKLRESGPSRFDDTQVLTYLVHYPGYPTKPTEWIEQTRRAGPGGSRMGEGSLSNTEWLTFSMTSRELEAKERALRAHRSQFGPLGGFLKIFINHYEYFGRLGPAQMQSLPGEYAARLARSKS